MDVGGEICILRNSGFVSVAKEYVPAQLPSFAAIERDPRRLILTVNVSSEKWFVGAPHLNPLPGGGARRSALRADQVPLHYINGDFRHVVLVQLGPHFFL